MIQDQKNKITVRVFPASLLILSFFFRLHGLHFKKLKYKVVWIFAEIVDFSSILVTQFFYCQNIELSKCRLEYVRRGMRGLCTDCAIILRVDCVLIVR